jgi:hypothetical protein
MASERQPRRALSMVATSILVMGIMASNARLALSPPALMASSKTAGVICQEMPHLSRPTVKHRESLRRLPISGSLRSCP